ncbi:putative lipid II flippase FtsW [bacterium]|nr:MAG: putative lipid II flippase FtsW [bacterium]
MMKALKIDTAIVIAVLTLMVLGSVMVYSASAVKASRDMGDGGFFFKKQTVFGMVALITMMVASMIPYGFWRVAVVPLLVLTVGLLAAVITPLGHTANNATRWFKIGPISLQIAEFAKLIVVMYLARYLSGREDELRNSTGVLIRPLIIITIIIVLIAYEPDLGTAIFIGLLGCIMFFIAGTPLRFLAGVGLVSAPAVAYLIMGKEFRVQRIRAFMDPWKEYDGPGFQLVQSFLAFGDGGALGTGLGGGKSKLLFLPESHTDFILAVVGEELGFVGVAVVLALFAVLVVRGMQVARDAPDAYGTLLASGLTMMIGLQALINSMVVLGLLPTKGMPLPFISYGGSSLLTSAAAVGILLNVAAQGRAS